MTDPMAGVTEISVTLPVSASAYDALEKDRIMPGVTRVTHTMGVGMYVIPGQWVVTSTRKYTHAGMTQHWVTFNRVDS